MIPLSGRVPEAIFRIPRDGIDGGGVSVTFLVSWLSVLGFSRRKDYIGEGAESGDDRGAHCWRYAQEAIIKVVIIYLYVYDECLYTML